MTVYARTGMLTLLAAVIALGAVVPCAAQERRPQSFARSAAAVAAMLAPKIRQQPPDWARIDEKPLFSFAWASDFHLDDSRREVIARGMRFIDERLKPDFVLNTGDNNALPAPATDPKSPEPVGLRRQRFLKTWLGKHLKTPYVMIPGDNWPRDFEKVFGPTQFSFDYGGLHFLLTAPDRSHHGGGMEGLSVFGERTWKWMRGDLEKNRGRPVVVALHEPVFPPTFLDAGRFRQLLDRYPNVIAVFQGHLHVDMELTSGTRTYLVCPALGPGRPPAMKHLLVYQDAIIIRTAEYDKGAGRFRLVAKWQKIDVPKHLRKHLKKPLAKRFRKENPSSVPAHPLCDAPELARRVGELVSTIEEFVNNDLPGVMFRAVMGR